MGVPWMRHGQRWKKWKFIAPQIRAAHRQCTVLDYLFAANFGLHCLVPVLKKESLGSGPRSKQPCGRLMHNIWPDCVRRLRQAEAIAQLAVQSDRGLNSIEKAGRQCPHFIVPTR